MSYSVSHEEKVVCVWSAGAPLPELEKYRERGYKICFFQSGTKPLKDVLRPIILRRIV